MFLCRKSVTTNSLICTSRALTKKQLYKFLLILRLENAVHYGGACRVNLFNALPSYRPIVMSVPFVKVRGETEKERQA